jgi:hypothetical protein
MISVATPLSELGRSNQQSFCLSIFKIKLRRCQKITFISAFSLTKMMSKHYQFYGVGILLLGTMTLCDVAQAQYPPPPAIDYLKPEQIRPDLYGPNGSDPAPRFRSPSQSSPSTSQSTPESIDQSSINAPPQKKGALGYLCDRGGEQLFQSRGFGPISIAIFKQAAC